MIRCPCVLLGGLAIDPVGSLDVSGSTRSCPMRGAVPTAARAHVGLNAPARDRDAVVNTVSHDHEAVLISADEDWSLVRSTAARSLAVGQTLAVQVRVQCRRYQSDVVHRHTAHPCVHPGVVDLLTHIRGWEHPPLSWKWSSPRSSDSRGTVGAISDSASPFRCPRVRGQIVWSHFAAFHRLVGQ